MVLPQAQQGKQQPLYTTEERRRRDESPWTLVQGVLALAQFVVFLISIGLILRYLATGNGLMIASASVVLKTFVLYVIMVTGSIWEREVFGRYLFAPAFFWEDAVSMVVIALHTAYLFSFLTDSISVQSQLLLAGMAYTAYAINAAQFILKFRAARREGISHPSTAILAGETV